MRRTTSALVAAAALFAAGCGTNETGTPTTQAETTTLQAPVFNPCDELNDDALQAAGLDPSTKSTSIDSPDGQPSAWKICRWAPGDDQPYTVGVGTSTYGQEDLADNPTVTGFEDVRIGSRAGKKFHQSGNSELLRCYVSFPADGGGMHNVILGWRTSQKESIPESPPCTLAVEQAKELEPYLP